METATGDATMTPSTLRLGLRALGDFAVVAIVGALAILLLQLGLMATQAAIPASLAGAMLLEQACMVLALLWWDRWRPLPAPTAPLPTPWPRRKAWLVGALGGCLLLLLNPALTWLLGQAGIEVPIPANDALIRESLAQAPLLEMASIGLLAPWLEERFVRGRLFGRFRNAGKPVVGLVLTSLLFALLHEFGPDPGQRVAEWLALIGLYAWMGAMFGLLYLWSGRLQTAIVAHAVNNLVLGGLYLLELA
ncbi:hypothetical protein MASR1M8_05190 [Thermomonas brevis]